MKFNTVVLYDIENLIKGYGFNEDFAQQMNLKGVFDEIAEYEAIDKIGIQRAYANWGNPRLGFMGTDITSLGIEPVQVFGFGRGASKNAADFHLVIDAIELCHTKVDIEVFVIVSGDGGFSALGKKLHEYGKIVVGCAYKGTTSEVFKSVCDHFIYLPDPDDELRAKTKERRIVKPKANQRPTTSNNRSNSSSNGRSKRKVVAPVPKKEATPSPNQLAIEEELIATIKPISIDASIEDKLAKINMILYWVSKHQAFEEALKTKGIPPSKLKTLFKAVLTQDVNTSHVGYLKFTNFLRFVCANTPLALYKTAKAFRIGFRNHPIDKAQLQPDAKRLEIHSTQGYRKILKYGKPIFRVPNDKFLLWDVIEELVNGNHLEKTLEVLIKDIKKPFINLPEEEIKQVLFILLAAECFERTPEDVPLAQQTLLLYQKFSSEKSIINHLKLLFFEKIVNMTQQDVKSEVLMQII